MPERRPRRGPTGRRRRPAARGVHADRRARRRASARADRPRASRSVRRPRWRSRSAPSPRAFAPRPVVYRDHRPAQQRVPRPGRRRGLRAGRGQPDDRLPRVLPLRPRARGCSPSSSRLSPGSARRRPSLHVMIPFVRTRWELEACLELVDASPARPAARPAPVGDGRGALGRLLASRSTSGAASTASRSAATTSPSSCSASTATRDRAPSSSTRPTPPSLDAIDRIIAHRAPARRSVVPVRPGAAPVARSSPSTWCAPASRRSRSTPTPSTACAAAVGRAEHRVLLDAARERP